MSETIPNRVVRRFAGEPIKTVRCDILVLGAGVSGVAAAHAVDLAGSLSLNQVDMAALQDHLYDNLERRD